MNVRLYLSYNIKITLKVREKSKDQKSIQSISITPDPGNHMGK